MVKILDEGLTYDDVLLVPRKTSVNSRKDVYTETFLTKKIKINIPIVPANMDTVTESQMAIAMAQAGSIGIVHRFNTIEEQVNEVLKVKEADSNYPDAVVDKKGRLIVGATVGVKNGFMERTGKLVDADVDVILVDVAHGHSERMLQTVRELRREFPDIELIGGNVVTGEATKELIDAGVDAVKVGIGPGSTCTTRLITGSGVPQLTAVIHCSKVANKYKIPIIADGGIRYPGDITKALAAGASSVMSGKLFAATDESPSPFVNLVNHDGRLYKVYRGSSSYATAVDRVQKNKSELQLESYVPEGVEGLVPCLGSVSELLKQLVGGLRSGMSYCGAKNIEELRKNAVFMKISENAKKESLPHDMKVIK